MCFFIKKKKMQPNRHHKFESILDKLEDPPPSVGFG
jgi:hypothetical protein